MQYVPQKELKKYREKNKPTFCPLLDHKTKDWVVDHCHTGGTIRGVVSSEGNALLGRIENAYKRLSINARALGLPQALRNMANYLDRPQSNELHPEGFRQLYKRFSRLDKGTQLDILLKVGINRELIQTAKNSTERTKLYKSYLRNE
tara:strand:+ start:379 stop:819 length:441 start_codon:yes stop_codon:yes gene_type:complete